MLGVSMPLSAASNSHHMQRQQTSPPPPYELEAIVKMDHLNIQTTSGDEVTDRDSVKEAEEFEVLEGRNGRIGGITARKKWISQENNTATVMLNGAKQTARQLLQRIGPSFM